MILKKPYAFIIKHIKLFHLLLLIPMIYLIIKTRDIYLFFSNYVQNEYTFYDSTLISTLSSKYINIFMYIAVVSIILILLIISFVLQKKDKNTKMYNIGILYYIIIFFLITGSISIFNMVEESTLSNSYANIIRDLCFIVYYSEYFYIIFSFIKGIGFNIKHFNFKSELDNLEIDTEDNEEFELSINSDTYKAKRSLRRFLRELKYYYLENKFVFTIIFIFLIGGLGTYLYLNIEVYHKEYNETDNINFGYINFKINNSYLTDIGLNGRTIRDGRMYLILDMTITNHSYQDRDLNYSNIILSLGDEKIVPNVTLGNYFKDFGNIYTGNIIKKDSTNDYYLIYEFSKDIKASEYAIEAYNGASSLGGIGVTNIHINLDPLTVSNNNVTNNVNLNNPIDLSNTNLLNSKVTIKDYSFTNRYVYTVNNTLYDIYINLSQDLNKTLMVIDYDLTLDKNSKYMNSSNDYKNFFEDFMTIKYTVNNVEYTSNVKLSNPKNYQDKLVFRINNNIINADSIKAIITIRNISYSVKLK